MQETTVPGHGLGSVGKRVQAGDEELGGMGQAVIPLETTTVIVYALFPNNPVRPVPGVPEFTEQARVRYAEEESS